MSETVVTIHYQAEDPFKVPPRPTRIQFDDAGNVKTTGGEGELQGDQLIGLSRQDPAPGGHGLPDGETVRNIYGPPTQFDPENWVGAEDLISEGAATCTRGWFPTFISEDGEWIYTRRWPVDRVEVTVR